MQLNLVSDEGGEWEGLYIDGVLQLEGHSLEVREVLEYIVAYLQEHKSIPTVQFSAETLKMDPYKFSRMPNEYKDLPKNKEFVMRKLPKYGDLLTIYEFVESVREGCFIDYDGFGEYATETEVSDKVVKPSDVNRGKIDYSFSHVMWYNR